MATRAAGTSAIGLLVVLFALALTLPGCGAPQAAPTIPTAKASEAPSLVASPPLATQQALAPQAQSTKVLTVIMGQEPSGLFPGIGSTSAQVEIFGGLWTDCVMRDDKNNYIPWGCEQVPTVDNGGAKFVGGGADRHLEATFRIKKGLRWHDGTPVTSGDVKFSVEALQNPEVNVEQRDLALRVADVQTPDEQTAVVIFLSENQAKQAAREGWKFANAAFYEGYDRQVGPVLHPEYFTAADPAMGHLLPAHILSQIDPKDWGQSDYVRRPVGNGPYKIREWVPGQMLVVEAADNGLLRPIIQTIVFQFAANSASVLNAMTVGEAQVALLGLDLDQTPDIDNLALQGKVKPHYVPASAWEHVDFNLRNPILADKKVRQAIAHAVDRQTMVDKLLYGKSQVLHSWIAPPNWGLDEAALNKYDYDPQKAKDLLAQAGWEAGADGILVKDGKQLRLKLQTTTATLRQNVGLLLQDYLKQVGIALEPDYLPGRGLFEPAGPLMQRTFDTAVYTWFSPPDPDPSNLYLGRNCPGSINYPCFQNAEFDRLTLQQGSELSQAERKPLLGQMLKIWTDELPALPLFQRVTVTATAPNLQGFKPTSSVTPSTWNIHEWFLPGA